MFVRFYVYATIIITKNIKEKINYKYTHITGGFRDSRNIHTVRYKLWIQIYFNILLFINGISIGY